MTELPEGEIYDGIVRSGVYSLCICHLDCVICFHEDPQVIFFCDQHDFLVAKDALSGRVTEEFPAVRI